jgi:hypothetical protein
MPGLSAPELRIPAWVDYELEWKLQVQWDARPAERSHTERTVVLRGSRQTAQMEFSEQATVQSKNK